MVKVKIKRIKHPLKPVATKDKIMAGFGLGAALVGGMGGFSKQPQNTQIVSTANNPNSASLKEKLVDIFGIPKALADNGGDDSPYGGAEEPTTPSEGSGTGQSGDSTSQSSDTGDADAQAQAAAAQAQADAQAAAEAQAAAAAAAQAQADQAQAAANAQAAVDAQAAAQQAAAAQATANAQAQASAQAAAAAAAQADVNAQTSGDQAVTAGMANNNTAITAQGGVVAAANAGIGSTVNSVVSPTVNASGSAAGQTTSAPVPANTNTASYTDPSSGITYIDNGDGTYTNPLKGQSGALSSGVYLSLGSAAASTTTSPTQTTYTSNTPDSATVPNNDTYSSGPYQSDENNFEDNNTNTTPVGPQTGDTQTVNGQSQYYDGTQWVDSATNTVASSNQTQTSSAVSQPSSSASFSGYFNSLAGNGTTTLQVGPNGGYVLSDGSELPSTGLTVVPGTNLVTDGQSQYSINPNGTLTPVNAGSVDVSGYFNSLGAYDIPNVTSNASITDTTNPTPGPSASADPSEFSSVSRKLCFKRRPNNECTR